LLGTGTQMKVLSFGCKRKQHLTPTPHPQTAPVTYPLIHKPHLSPTPSSQTAPATYPLIHKPHRSSRFIVFAAGAGDLRIAIM